MKKKFTVFLITALITIINCNNIQASTSTIVLSRKYADPHTNIFTIMKDDLPFQIDANEIQLAFIIPTDECPLTGDNKFLSPMKFYCLLIHLSMMDEKLNQFNPITIPLSQNINSVTEVLNLSSELSRRYIALIDWHATTYRSSSSYSQLHLLTEEVLYDRLEKKWLWHAIRKNSTLSSNTTTIAEVSPFFINHILKITNNITQRGQAIGKGKRYNYTPLTFSEIAEKPVGENGRIVLLNNYFQTHKEGVRSDGFRILKASENIDDAHNKLNFGVDLRLGYKSYAAFDVEPGDYVLISNGKVVENITLKSGDSLNFTHSRGFLNRNVISEISKDETSVEIKKYTNGVLSDTNAVYEARFSKP